VTAPTRCWSASATGPRTTWPWVSSGSGARSAASASAVRVLDGRIEPGKVFDRTVGLDQTPDGYRAMDQRTALKVMIQP
jgi:threonine dehydrogenase-like Zn-dependent dehydrogenase